MNFRRVLLMSDDAWTDKTKIVDFALFWLKFVTEEKGKPQKPIIYKDDLISKTVPKFV